MFKHKVDPEVQAQIDEIKADMREQNERVNTLVKMVKEYDEKTGNTLYAISQTIAAIGKEYSALRGDLEAVEQKLDEVLNGRDAAARSILGEEQPKPEPFNAAPGHIPWSQRKKAREQASRSPAFIEKVKKGAATTETPPAPEEKKNE